MSKKTLCLDFDGVIRHPKTNLFVPGAIEFVIKCINSSFKIYICSARKDYGWMIEWTHEELYQKLGPQHAQKIMTHLNWYDKKPQADVYLDDRALNFDGTWPEIMSNLLQFKPWWKL